MGRDKRTAVEIQCILPNVKKADLESSLNFLENNGKIKKVSYVLYNSSSFKKIKNLKSTLL